MEINEGLQTQCSSSAHGDAIRLGWRALSDSLAEHLKKIPIDEGFFNGGCDAVALALFAHLKRLGVDQMTLSIVARETEDEDGEVIDTNMCSHVVLSALGTTWDAQGTDALERWEADWCDRRTQTSTFFIDDEFNTPEELIAALYAPTADGALKDFPYRPEIEAMVAAHLSAHNVEAQRAANDPAASRLRRVSPR